MSSGTENRPHPLTEHALRQLIHVALERGYYTECLHHPERNISADDVIHGLERSDWTLITAPELHGRSYRYEISTLDVEGDQLTLIVEAHPEEKRIEIITAW